MFRQDPFPSAPRARRGTFALALAFLLALVLAPGSGAQQGAFVTGTVRDAAGDPVVGATVHVPEAGVGALTDARGAYRLGPLAPGTHAVRATSLGYEAQERAVAVGATGASADFRLETQPVMLPGIQISVMRPDVRPDETLDQGAVRQANPRDVGEALRTIPGVDAVRRGPLGLDPVVRGLREAEIGVYMDGARQLSAGPARMDSPLTHVDPSTLESVEVVKGPYAHTLGAGNMGAIRVETQPVPPAVPGPLHGRALLGYDGNLGALEAAGSLSGERDALAYWLHGAWREGGDYESGSGAAIPGDFLSREVRGKVGYRLAPGSWLTVSGGYQWQDDLDYPGRVMDADFFRASNLSAAWSRERPDGLVRSVEALAYRNVVDHGMDNDEKPTAQPMPGRTPPFALDVRAETAVSIDGGRLAAVLAPSDALEVEVGGDVYRANHDAWRTIARRDIGTMLFEDLIWPDATITDAGVFARVESRHAGRLTLTATARLDRLWARADTASPFFRENVPADLDAEETHFGGSLVASVQPTSRWSVSLGAGTAVRAADANERYSDRFPASKAQTSAEFMGNPALDPERSTQADLWVEASYPRLSLSLNAFARRIDDYITLEATDLPKRLPLSPDTVYRYVNGEAEFWGAEATLGYALLDPLRLGLSASFLRGTDTSLDEPALGVSPPRLGASLRWEPDEAGYYLEGSLQAVGEQERVSRSRGELATEGFTTVDAEAGIRLPRGALLRVGVKNLLDAEYINHLNARNPFSGVAIPEPGRVLFARVSYAF